MSDPGTNSLADMMMRGVKKAGTEADTSIDGLAKAAASLDMRETEAKLAAYALIGKPAPAYVALPAAPITRDGLLAAWQEIYHQPAPDKVVKSMK